jgi:hypothetical protein
MTANSSMTPLIKGGGFSSQSSIVMQLEENPEMPYPEVKKMRQAI